MWFIYSKSYKREPKLTFEMLNAALFERLNQQAYDQFSHVYEKITLDQKPTERELQKSLLGKFVDNLTGERSVLDIGCGVGYNLKILAELSADLSGLDISSEMLRYASQRCPQARLYLSSLAEFETEKEFEGVVMEAFIHLFPRTEVEGVLDKVKSLIKPDGIGTLTTTISADSYEGFFTKEGYPQERRFRRFWKPSDLISTVEESGFKILNEQQYPNFGKYWVRLTFRK